MCFIAFHHGQRSHFEDEPAIAESLSFALRRDGFAVDIADCLAQVNGKIDLADLVLLDLMLPDGSGFDLIVQIRRRALRPAIIVLSSRDEEADRVAALESGADDYVTKPFSPREVVARVRAVLRRAQPFEAPELHLSCSSIQVDVTTRRAVVQGTVLELTRVEFDLLACLIEEPGRVYTRSQLIDKVWGDGFAITDRTVDSHVKGLRKKMVEAGGDPNLVETVRGVGYRIALVSSVQSEP
ncbi:MAG TPA: response regulator transcription factor [Polyangiaceae bacterium]|nr:response regulator transcription factor [Polyangiaceae bacterium]